MALRGNEPSRKPAGSPVVIVVLCLVSLAFLSGFSSLDAALKRDFWGASSVVLGDRTTQLTQPEAEENATSLLASRHGLTNQLESRGEERVPAKDSLDRTIAAMERSSNKSENLSTIGTEFERTLELDKSCGYYVKLIHDLANKRRIEDQDDNHKSCRNRVLEGENVLLERLLLFARRWDQSHAPSRFFCDIMTDRKGEFLKRMQPIADYSFTSSPCPTTETTQKRPRFSFFIQASSTVNFLLMRILSKISRRK